MKPEDDLESAYNAQEESGKKRIVLDLTEQELDLLRLKRFRDEPEVETVKRILGEALERDAIEKALVKLIDSLEVLIVMQKRDNRMRTGDYEETYRQIQTLENAITSVNELKGMLERNWEKY